MYSYRYIWAWVLEKRPFFHEKSALWWLLSQLGSPHFRFMSFQNEIFTNIFELAFQNKKDHFFSWKIRLGISIINRNFEVQKQVLLLIYLRLNFRSKRHVFMKNQPFENYHQSQLWISYFSFLRFQKQVLLPICLILNSRKKKRCFHKNQPCLLIAINRNFGVHILTFWVFKTTIFTNISELEF